MSKKYSATTHVFYYTFDNECLFFGPRLQANIHIAKICGRHVRTIADWRSGKEPCPKWAYELIRLTVKERRETLNQTTGHYRASSRLFLSRGFKIMVAGVHQWGNFAANDSVTFGQIPVAEEK